MKLIYPAFVLLRPLSIMQKILLLLVLAILPFSYMFTKLYAIQSQQIETTQKERVGAKLNNLIFDLTIDIQKLRGITFNINSNSNILKNESQKLLEKITTHHQNLIFSFLTQHDDYRKLKPKFKTIFSQIKVLSHNEIKDSNIAYTNFNAFTLIINDLTHIIHQVSLNSTLSLDPIPQTHLAYDICFNTTMALLEDLGALRAHGSIILSKQIQTPLAISQFTRLFTLYEFEQYSFEHKVHFYNELSGNSHKKVLIPSQNANHIELQESAKEISNNYISRTSESFFRLSNLVINIYIKSYKELQKNLLFDLKTRQDLQESQLYWYFAILFSLFLVIDYILLTIFISFHNNIQSLITNTENMALQNYNKITFDTFSDDELLKVARGLNYLTQELEQNQYVINQFVLFSRTDLSGHITEVSDSFCKLTGYKKEELIGKTHGILRSDKTPDSLYKEMWSHLTADKPFATELMNFKKNGDPFWVFVMIQPIFDNHKVKTGYTAFRHDISSQKIAEKIAIIDPLTRLNNRQYFDRYLQKSYESFNRYETPYTLLMLDIDHFKQINDTFGHLQGDIVLKELAKLFKTAFRESDTIARWGGEEFMVLLQNTTLDKACKIANKFLHKVANAPINGEHPVTLSIGVTDFQKDDTIETILIRVDSLLYTAKENGRNQVCCFHNNKRES